MLFVVHFHPEARFRFPLPRRNEMHDEEHRGRDEAERRNLLQPIDLEDP